MARAKAELTLDYHGWTAEAMRWDLSRRWASGVWNGLKRIEVVHGTGEVLGAELRLWAEENGISWSPVNGNAGAAWLHPGSRLVSRSETVNRPLLRPLGPIRAAMPNSVERETVPDPTDSVLFDQELERLRSGVPPKR